MVNLLGDIRKLRERRQFRKKDEKRCVILEVKSEVLGESVYFVADDVPLYQIPQNDYPVYFASDLIFIIEENIDEEMLKAIHLTKKKLGRGVRIVGGNNTKKEEEKMGELADYANAGGKFVSLDDGASIELVFKSYDFVTSSFDKEKKVVEYAFDFNGQTKKLQSASGPLARTFDTIKPGTKVKLTREGMDEKTSYKVEVIKDEWDEETKEV